ncbi:hypothetical protein EPH95_17045 [Salicibibacter halophilus]|uniref:Uncharacterized protein n=1 Tax=Salicibibacter halophilus TaxID=2502791 RepID=A0A514LMY1_9BACI|nr:hypothetical protein [Salicibibacter halophilus]QDI93193.1 hypothetical protein EPH95_17045 [Salicibibacter halophilus]
MALVIFWAIVLASIVFMVKKKQPLFLGVPILALGVYIFIEILRVPLPFTETVQFIFDLQ